MSYFLKIKERLQINDYCAPIREWFARKLYLVFRGVFSCFIQIGDGNNEIPS